MEDFEKQQLRGSEESIRQALSDIGVALRGRTCRCPFHDDKNASAGIYHRDGVWKFKCQTCKVNEDVIGIMARAKGIKSGEVLKENTLSSRAAQNSKPKEKAVVYPTIDAIRDAFRATDVFPYTDPKTTMVDLLVLRRDRDGGKDITQCKRVDGGFTWGQPIKPANGFPIFNRGRIASADLVFVVEGEKKVKILTLLGFTGTTSPMGAGKASLADWSPLSGKQTVVLWPDHDELNEKGKRTGHEHMRAVYDLLTKLQDPPEIRWVDPEFFELPPKGDIEQYLEMYGGETHQDKQRSIQTVIEIAQPINGSAGLQQMLEDTISGKRSVIPLPWSVLDHFSQALIPGTITCVCGDPGCSKSFWLTQAGLFWHKEGVKIAIFMLEEDRAYHLQRALALLDGNADLTQMRWVKSHPEEVRQAYSSHQKVLDGFARCIYDAPDLAMTLEQLADWVEERAAAGCKIIAIDPITAAEVGDKRFTEDAKFMFRVKTTARSFGCRIILTTHPRNGAKGWLDMAGGAAFPRFSQTVFWIHAHDPPKKLECSVYQGDAKYAQSTFEVNRTIKLGKTRNGAGGGSQIAFEFEKQTLRFLERGPVVKTRKDESDE